MARADRRRAAREARRVQHRPRASGGGARAADQTMFFPRLRAHAKWMFVLLAIVFAAGFVLFGVGSGSTGLGDLLRGDIGLFGGGSTSSSAVKKAREAIKKNPSDAQAYLDLANALQTEGKPNDAIPVLEKLHTLKPKNEDALSQLAALYLRQAQDAQLQGQAVQAASPTPVDSGSFAPDSTSKLGQALRATADPLTSYDPINNAVSSELSTKLGAIYTEVATAYKQAVSVYKQLAALSPADANVQFQLAQAAESAGDRASAIAAYKGFLKLAPDDPTAPAVRQRVKDLEKQQAAPAVSVGR